MTQRQGRRKSAELTGGTEIHGPAAISLRTWLVYLTVAGSLGALLVAAAAGWVSWKDQKERIGFDFLATSRSLVVTVDRELDQAVALARGLSTSNCLTIGALPCFDRQAREALSPYGYELILTAADSGRELVNTHVPPGAPTPRSATATDWIEPEVMSGHIAVKPLTRSALSGGWIVAVQVPVLEGGKVRYAISIVIPDAVFQKMIDEQRFPADWNAVVLDHRWTIVARVVKPDAFVGKQGATSELKDTPEPDSVYETHVLEGDWSLAARSRSLRYGWTVAVSMPEAAIFSEFLGSVLLMALGGFLVAAIAVGAVIVLTARLMRGIRLLDDATGALANDEPVILPRLPVRELATVGERMQTAANKLRDHAKSLEARVAEVSGQLAREAEERQKTEATLAHAQRLESLGQLTGGIAHDFNNLLMAISGTLDLMERRSTTDDQRRLLQIARSGTARGARLVEALLAFARKQPVHPRTSDVTALIEEFTPMLKGALGDAIELQLRLQPGVRPCKIDPAQFQSAILNLATNARAAMPNGGRLTIEAEDVDPGKVVLPPELPPGAYVRISVSDTGVGMPQSSAIRAFEPFFTTKEVGKGTGLGLSQVYGFAKQSGGLVRLASELGRGTTVTLFLPVGRESPTADAAYASASPGAHQTSARVLVVDDDPDVRAIMVEGLGELGYSASAAANGPEALSMVSSGMRVDVLLTDYAMPQGMTGRELGRRIVAARPGTKVILISGNLPGGQEGPSEFPVVHKPLRLSELDSVIRTALGLAAETIGETEIHVPGTPPGGAAAAM